MDYADKLTPKPVVHFYAAAPVHNPAAVDIAWIERKKRIFLHFIPTSASWANLVERFFAILTQKQIRRGVFTSVPHLEKCLRESRLQNSDRFGAAQEHPS